MIEQRWRPGADSAQLLCDRDLLLFVKIERLAVRDRSIPGDEKHQIQTGFAEGGVNEIRGLVRFVLIENELVGVVPARVVAGERAEGVRSAPKIRFHSREVLLDHLLFEADELIKPQRPRDGVKKRHHSDEREADDDQCLRTQGHGRGFPGGITITYSKACTVLSSLPRPSISTTTRSPAPK